jgi:ATP-binding cassette subfamily F protein 3
VVSHDRDFLDGLVDKVFEFRNQKVKEHLGGIYDFLKRKKLESLKELERKKIKENVPEKNKDASENKDYYLRKKEIEKGIRKMKSKIRELEKNIASCESEIEKLNNKMQNNEVLLEQDSYKSYEEVQKKAR